MSDTDSGLNLIAIRSRLSEASPGPWEAADEHELVAPSNPAWYVCQVRPGWEAMPEEEGYVEDVACMVQRDHEQAKANAQFMAHARQDVPALLAEVERLRSEMRMRELHHFEEEQKRIEAEEEVQRLRKGIVTLAATGLARTGEPKVNDLRIPDQSADYYLAVLDDGWRNQLGLLLDLGSEKQRVIDRNNRIDAVLDVLIPGAADALGTHSLEDVAKEFGVDLDDDACDECHGVDDHFTDCNTLADQEGKS